MSRNQLLFNTLCKDSHISCSQKLRDEYYFSHFTDADIEADLEINATVLTFSTYSTTDEIYCQRALESVIHYIVLL